MEEEEALEYSREAMYDDNRDKAKAILNRFDTLQAEAAEAEAAGDGESDAGGTGADGPASSAQADDEDDSVFASTAAGMLDPFTDEETSEDDIGGYAYDIAFVFNSLTSKMFRIVGLFMIVMGGTFFWLYSGGLGRVLETFLARVPDEVLREVALRNGVDPVGLTFQELIMQMDIVIALHPVEVLIFEVKVSVLAAIVAVLPLVLYYAWPALKERGLVYGDRRIFVVWGGSLLGGFAFGTYLGFFWIAPAVISYLVSDAITNGWSSPTASVASSGSSSSRPSASASSLTSSSRWRSFTSAVSSTTARCSPTGGPSSSASSPSPPSPVRKGSSRCCCSPSPSR